MASTDKIIWSAKKVRLGDLIPWERNPRRINDAQAARLQESFDEFGQIETVAVGPSSEVYNGHQRLKVLMAKMGPDFEIDARISSRPLTEKEREKLTIYLHSGTIGEFDYEMLAEEFELPELEAWGFSDEDILKVKDLLNDPKDSGGAPGDAEPKLDLAEELRESWGTEEGQLWELGRHRLLCGDCTLTADVARVLAGTKPQLMVTDPPYGVEYDPTWRADAGVNKNQKKMRKVKNDNRADWYEAWALFPGDVVYVYHAGVMTPIVQASIERCGFETRAQIIWAKDRMALSRGDYHWHHEPIIYAVRKGARSHRTDDRTQTTLWTIAARDDAGLGHGTQKPLECMARPIRNHTLKEVYDPFAGSGTTIIACEQLSRTCYAMDLDPACIAVTLERFLDATGILPILVK